MTNVLRRWLSVVSITATVAVGAAISADPAQASPVDTGTLTMESDPGDYIGGGGTYSYSTSSADSFNASATDNGSQVTADVFAANGDDWFLDFEGTNNQPLTAGTYKGAIRFPFNPITVPGLSIFGNGRGCNTLTGDFVVNAAEFGPAGYIVLFDVTFEQHCEGGTPALRGHLVISNPPPPAPLELGKTVAATGEVSTVSGNATVHGTVTCTQAVTVNLNASLTQVVKKEIVRGGSFVSFSCTPGTPVPWQLTIVPSNVTPFQKGDAELSSQASAQDPNFGNTVTVSSTDIVTLRK